MLFLPFAYKMDRRTKRNETCTHAISRVSLSLPLPSFRILYTYCLTVCFSILTIIKNQLKTNTVTQVVAKAQPFCNLLSPYQTTCMDFVFVLVTSVSTGNFVCDCTPGEVAPPTVLQPLFDLFEAHAKYNALHH